MREFEGVDHHREPGVYRRMFVEHDGEDSFTMYLFEDASDRRPIGFQIMLGNEALSYSHDGLHYSLVDSERWGHFPAAPWLTEVESDSAGGRFLRTIRRRIAQTELPAEIQSFVLNKLD